MVVCGRQLSSSRRDRMIVAWQFIAREIGPNKNRPVRVRCDQE